MGQASLDEIFTESHIKKFISKIARIDRTSVNDKNGEEEDTGHPAAGHVFVFVFVFVYDRDDV